MTIKGTVTVVTLTTSIRNLVTASACDPVTVLDQDGNTVEAVAAGGTYEVIVLDSIEDNGTGPYILTVIDPG